MLDNNINLVDSLKEKGIKPSVQRMEILNFMINNRIHPNVETIYKALVDKIPTLSKATVYNTLDLFEKQGLAKSLYIEPHEVRYDINTNLHAHFKCEKCKAIKDYEVFSMKTELNNNDFKGVIISEEINYRGICEDCAKKS